MCGCQCQCFSFLPSSHTHLLVPVTSENFLATCSDIAWDYRGCDMVSFGDHRFTDIPKCPHPPLSEGPYAIYEAKSYYYGLPSTPLSVYHTGAPWKRPTGLKAYRIPKGAWPICNHLIADMWDELGPQVLEYPDSINVK